MLPLSFSSGRSAPLPLHLSLSFLSASWVVAARTCGPRLLAAGEKPSAIVPPAQQRLLQPSLTDRRADTRKRRVMKRLSCASAHKNSGLENLGFKISQVVHTMHELRGGETTYVCKHWIPRAFFFFKLAANLRLVYSHLNPEFAETQHFALTASTKRFLVYHSWIRSSLVCKNSFNPFSARCSVLLQFPARFVCSMFSGNAPFVFKGL